MHPNNPKSKMKVLDMDQTDRIERQLTLPIPREQVWQALTDPVELAIWFADGVELDPRPGGQALFEWGEGDKCPAILERVEPPHRLAFHWRSYKSDPQQPVTELPSTLVEFTLEEMDEGEATLLTLVESGFSGLPDEIRDRSRADNERGWDEELQDLRTYFTARPLPAM